MRKIALSLLLLPSVLMAGIASGSMDLAQPAYLRVPAFKSCLVTQSAGSSSHWCMPKRQPSKCPEASWKALQDLKIPACTHSSASV
jgi:hypothetical protein